MAKEMQETEKDYEGCCYISEPERTSMGIST